jgi:hypothetical protein
MEAFDPAGIALEPRAADSLVPLTSAQLDWWRSCVEEGRLSNRRISLASVRIYGQLNVGLLQKSLEAAAQQHESLRTRIITVDGIPRQHLDPGYERDLELADLSNVSLMDREREARHAAEDFKKRKVDLSVGPLFESKLIRLSDLEHILVLTTDHIISDAVSSELLSKDVWALYGQAVQGLSFSLPKLPLQFADYAVWQQRIYHACVKRHETYWKTRLAGAKRVDLRADTGLSDAEPPSTAFVEFPFAKALSVDLVDRARRERTILPLFVLATYVAVISRWCERRDFVLAFVSHGRYQRALQSMVGLLAHPLPFRIELGRDDAFLDVLRKVNLEFCAAYRYQHVDLTLSSARECVSPILFNWLPTGPAWRIGTTSVQYQDQVRIQPFPILVRERVVSDSTVWLTVGGSYDVTTGIVASVQYRTDFFAPATIERFGHNLRVFSQEFARDPRSRISSMRFQ